MKSGIVIERLPQGRFKLDNNEVVFLTGKLRYHHINIIIGDKVYYDEYKRIIRREK